MVDTCLLGPVHEFELASVNEAAHCNADLLAPREAFAYCELLARILLLRPTLLLLLDVRFPARELLPRSSVLREESLQN